VAALEGLAGGRPVVATRVGGTREVVPAPRAGRVVDPMDPVAIAAAILDLLDHPPSARACRAAAAPSALPRQARKVAAILEAAVARRAGGDVSETA
jgi:glycosyltransferase involved in cell wall biosynthesis